MKQKKSRKLTVILLIILALALGLAALYYFVLREKPKEHTFINYDPPTKSEQSAGDDQKQKIADEDAGIGSSENPGSGGSEKEITTVIISGVGQVDTQNTPNDYSDDIIDVRAYMPQRYESGSCTTTLTKGSHKVTKTTEATKDMNYTICDNPMIARSELPEGGDWRVEVVYSSDVATGDANTTLKGVK